MECKNCKQQLEQGVTICPECGTDNTPAAAQGIMLTPGKLVAIVAGVVALTALVVALVMGGMGFSFNKPVETQPVESEAGDLVQETMPVPTVPADGNPDDATCKGTYTVSDEEVAANRTAVVATVGSQQLTNAELQIYYWLEVQNFLANYGSYASYFGLDVTQPLDTQICGISDNPVTWQQYFLASALADWQNYAALAEESLVNDFVLDQEYVDMIAKLPETLATDGGVRGFATAEEFLAYNVGAGATIADYQSYMNTYYQGFMYFQSQYETMVPTVEEMEAYFAEHEAEYTAEGINKDDYTVDVRHILILPEGATLETIRTETFPEEAWAAGEKQAQEILDQWLAGEQTEEMFALFANDHSADPGSNTMGGLYVDVYVGQMVEEFEAWCFDEARQPGDYGIVRTSLGFHIMYFSSSRPVWQSKVEEDMLGERGMALITATTDKYPMTVEYGKIMLGYVNLNK